MSCAAQRWMALAAQQKDAHIGWVAVEGWSASAVPGLSCVIVYSLHIRKGTDCNAAAALVRERRGTGTAAETVPPTRRCTTYRYRYGNPPALYRHAEGVLIASGCYGSHHTGRDHQHGGVQSAMRRYTSPSPSPSPSHVSSGHSRRPGRSGVAIARNASPERDHRGATTPAEGLTRAIPRSSRPLTDWSPARPL